MVCTLKLSCAFTYDRIGNDDRRFCGILYFIKCFFYIVIAVTVDLHHIPVLCRKTCRHIFTPCDAGISLDSDLIAVIDKHEILQSQMPGQGACFIRDTFLKVTIPTQAVDFVVYQLAGL